MLHTLCVDGSFDDIRRVLETSNFDVNATNENGLTPIHLCAFRSDDMIKVMELLSDRGADLNAKTLYEGDTVLHLLVRNVGLLKAETVIVELLRMGADPTASNKTCRSASDEAMMRNYRYLSDLFSKRISLEEAKEEQKKYRYEYYGELLIEAIRKGDEKEIKVLLKKANVNYRNRNGAAPIHYIIKHCPLKKADILRELLMEDADVNIVDYEGDTALNLLIKQKNLREDGTMYELVEILTKAGTDPRFKDLDGQDAIKLASDNDYQDIKNLLQKHLDILLANLQKLFRALSEGKMADIKECLDKKGINANSLSQDGLAPIHVITLRNTTTDIKKEVINYLLDNKANINAKCEKDGNSALHLASKKKDTEIARFLIQKGIDQSLKNKDGLTAFELAVMGYNDLKAASSTGKKETDAKEKEKLEKEKLEKENLEKEKSEKEKSEKEKSEKENSEKKKSNSPCILS